MVIVWVNSILVAAGDDGANGKCVLRAQTTECFSLSWPRLPFFTGRPLEIEADLSICLFRNSPQSKRKTIN
jgi:hypothetical protein